MKTHIAVMLTNITAIIAFTVLAIYFGKWWIALLSAFFIMTYRVVEVDDE